MKKTYSFKQLIILCVIYGIALILSLTSLILIALGVNDNVHQIISNTSYVIVLIALMTNIYILEDNFKKYQYEHKIDVSSEKVENETTDNE